jgi:hypothetical protein
MKRSNVRARFLCGLLALLLLFVSTEGTRGSQVPFIPNHGQIDSYVVYYAKSAFGTLYVTDDDALVYTFAVLDGHEWRTLAIREKFPGSTSSGWIGAEESGTRVHLFLGDDPARWRSDLPTYRRIVRKDLYPGIDLELRVKGRSVEKIFHVGPGADPGSIRTRVRGASRLSSSRTGCLDLRTPFGGVRFSAPKAHQTIGGERRPVRVQYVILGPDYGFLVGDYDPAHPLFIDPLISSTFLGGGADEEPYAFIVSNAGIPTVAGWTQSTDFPVDPLCYDTTYNGGGFDVFISGFDEDLSELLYSTFLGGTNDEIVSALCANEASGICYVTGWTNSTDFPSTSGAYDTSLSYLEDGFVAGFDTEFGTLHFSTFLGGTSYDFPYGVAIGPGQDVYVTGTTYSTEFPVTPDAYDTTHFGNKTFVSRLSGSLDELRASTLLGGSQGAEAPCDVAFVSGSNEVLVAGWTSSPDFPVTAGAFDEFYSGEGDIFVSSLNDSLTDLIASTFLGGDQPDAPESMVLDSSGNVVLAGATGSTDFPTTEYAYDTSYSGGDRDGFVSVLQVGLGDLIASTYLGASEFDRAYGVCTGDSGDLYVAGQTSSPDFPRTFEAFDTTFNGGDDAFACRVSSDLTVVLASTYLGGVDQDLACGLWVDGTGHVLVAGQTQSQDFPVTPFAYDTLASGGAEVFVSKFDRDLSGYAVMETFGDMEGLTLWVQESPLFRGHARIRFSCPSRSRVSVTVYGRTGRVVKVLLDREMDAGIHALGWSGRDENGQSVSSGVYFIRLETEGHAATGKLLLLR